MSTQPIGQVILNSTFYTTLLTATANNKIYSINCVNRDTSSDTIDISYFNGASTITLAAITLPSLAGVNSTPLDLMDTLQHLTLGNGDRANRFISIPNGHQIRIKLLNNPDAVNNVEITAWGIL